MHYYKFNIGDYKTHTEHLELLEDLAFRRLMDWCYTHEKPLPVDVDDIARLIRMRTHSESIAYVLREFFELTNEGYINARIIAEVSDYQAKSKSASKSAKARWKNKPHSSAVSSDANALRTDSEGNAKHKTLNTKHKTLNNNNKPTAKSIVEQSSTDEVFKHWQTLLNHSRSKLDPKRAKLIKAALKLGYTVDDLKSAISGCSKTPHNIGQNESGQKYDGLHIILDPLKIDRFMNNDENAPTPQQQAKPMSKMDEIRANLGKGQALNVINQNEVIGHD